MKGWVVVAVFLSVFALLPLEAFAQGIDVGVSGVGLVSIQPRDDTYIGGPYLNEGLGGIGPGFGTGVNVITASGFVVAGEFTMARYELIQYGRLVGGFGPNEGAPHTSRLNDSLLSGLVGYGKTTGRTRALFLGGIGLILDSPTVDGVPQTIQDPPDGSTLGAATNFPLAVTGGIDVLRTLGTRTTLVVGGRYAFVERKNLNYLGIGPHVLRIGAGIRVRIN